MPQPGGTLRVVIPANAYSGGLRGEDAELLDPQLWDSSFFGNDELLRCCLQRTLFSHNGKSTEEGGARLQPDLAAALPDVSLDGLTWTIRIKPGLHYAPPLEGVEITSYDFVRSFARLFSPTLAVNQLAVIMNFDFTEIEGTATYQAGEAASISGLETPDDHTLVVHLSGPVGDFGARLAELVAGPIPANPADPSARLGIAEGADSGFGRFLVSSGPYMVEGADRLDFAVPASRRAAPSGFGVGEIALVRNPSWDRASDSLRPAYPDRIEIRLVDSVEAAIAAIDAGSADLLWPAQPGSIPADVYAAYQADPGRGSVHVSVTGVARYLIMNVALPPFDDIHVRKALNLAIDKQRLIDLGGGATVAQPFGHIAPDVYLDNLLADYDPYATPGSRGDLVQARAEMARSKYDANHDGTCDAAVCRNVRALVRESDVAVGTAVADQLRPLGLELQVEAVDPESFLNGTSSADAKNPLLIQMGFRGLDISAAEWMLSFDGKRTIDHPPDTTNQTMVGATPEQLRKWGYAVTDVPNVDDRVEACVPLVGEAQFACWAAADQYLMENVVPYVPYRVDRYVAITSPRVLTYGFDELVQTTALDQLALKQ